MREQLVAWAGDCVVTFHEATVRALDDGHELRVEELDVEHHELHLIEVQGRRGDPTRRLRTIEDRVTVEVGPFAVTGNLHRPPNTQPLAALGRWARFVPMTDATVVVKGTADGHHQDVVLVNRERIGTAEEIVVVPVYGGDATPSDVESSASA